MAGQINPKGFNDADLVYLLQAMRNRVLDFGSALPNLAPGTTTSKLKTGSAIKCVLDGVMKIQAAVDNQDVLTPFASLVIGASQGAAFRIESNGSVLSAKMGQIVPAGASDAIVTYLPMPVRTPGLATVGYLLVQGAFTPGTTAVTAGMCKDGDPDLVPGVNLSGYGTTGLVS